jgi:hypothetical protein
MGLLIQIIVGIIIISPILWLVGRGLVGKQKAKFTDAIWIVALGVIVGSLLTSYVHGIVGIAITLIIWLVLIKHFFDCGWLKAILVAIVAVVVLIVIAVILAVVLGYGITSLLGGTIPSLPSMIQIYL